MMAIFLFLCFSFIIGIGIVIYFSVTNNKKSNVVFVSSKQVQNSSVVFINNKQVVNNVNKKVNNDVKMPITLLLVIGSILVVFASVIFLVSSWDSLHGIFKVLILVFLQLMFFGLEFLATKKFEIPKTAKVFRYLALIFVPIVLISFLAFGVFTFNDMYGDTLYFAIVWLITDIVFKCISYVYKDVFIRKSSLLFEFLFLYFLLVYLRLDLINNVLILTLYNFSIYFLNQAGYLKDYQEYNWVLLIGINVLCLIDLNWDNKLTILIAAYGIFYFINSLLQKDTSYRIFSEILVIINFLVWGNILLDSNWYFLMIIPLMVTYLIHRNELARKSLLVILLLCLSGNFITSLFLEPLFLIINLTIIIIAFWILFIKENLHEFKYLSYIALVVSSIVLFMNIEAIEYAKYVPLFWGCIIYLIEYLYPKARDNFSSIVCIGIFLFESLALMGTYCEVIPLILLILLVCLEKRSEYLLILPMVTFLSFVDMFDWPLVGLGSILILTGISCYKKDFNMYTIFALLYIITISNRYSFDLLIFLIVMVIFSSLEHLFNKSSKLYMVLSLVSILGLYLDLVKNIHLYTFMFLGIYIAIFVLTRIIFKKEDIKVLEIILPIVVMLISLEFVNSAIDGLLYIVMMAIFSLFGFLMKWDYYYKVFIIGMVVNVFIKTFEYWKLIPWYVYILVIGLGLILFASIMEKKRNNK